MRKGIAAVAVTASMLLAVPAFAGAAPGQDVKRACGASFGELVSAGKSSSSAAHMNYAGGAKAFSDPAILAAHGCDG
jgi:hypothetical protein